MEAGLRTHTEESFESENIFSRYLQGTAFVPAAEISAAVRCGFVSISETAELAQEHSFLQVADCQNQLGSRPLQRRESQARIPHARVNQD
jgi:hypothetical protein